jgi:putative ABC transport system permease protein
MIILLKYLLHDMLVQYRRTLLVLVTLTVAAASMLSSVALSGTMVELGTNQWRAENGYSDIIVVPSPASSSRYFSQFVSEQFAGVCEYRVFRASAPATIMSGDGPVDADAVGFNLDEYLKMMKLHFDAQSNLFPFEGNKAVISRKTADNLGIGLGDIITADIGGNRHALEVCAIAYAEGPFAFERDNPALLLPCAQFRREIARKTPQTKIVKQGLDSRFAQGLAHPAEEQCGLDIFIRGP